MLDNTAYLYRPGFHSRNLSRRVSERRPPDRLNNFRFVLLIIGLACLGYFAYTWADQELYQSYQSWAFNKRVSGTLPKSAPLPLDGAIIGRVSVDRLNLSALVRQGVGDETLKEAVGHVPASALPGQPGNFAIAAHRDTLFRALKDIKIGDRITFQTESRLFTYQVAATKIVLPDDISVIRPDGGGLTQPGKLLTMITCYPFYYVGAAPKRFIVQAKLVD